MSSVNVYSKGTEDSYLTFEWRSDRRGEKSTVDSISAPTELLCCKITQFMSYTEDLIQCIFNQ